MNIAFIGRDDQLREQLQALQGVKAVYALRADQREEYAHLLDMSDLLMISDREVPPFELEVWVEPYAAKKLVYLASYQADAAAIADVEMISRQAGVDVMPPKRTAEQITFEIGRRYLHQTLADQGGKVMTIVGTLGGSGVTATALKLAEQLSLTSRQMKIGVIGFNCCSPGDAFMVYKGSYLNELHTQVEILSAGELIRHMHQHESGFWYLAGNADLTKKYRYPTEAAQHILACAKQAFDVVIVDAGTAVDNNLCLQAVMMADMRIVLTTSQHSALAQWRRQREVLQLIAPDLSYMMLLNHGRRAGEAKEVADQMKLPSIGWLPHVEGAWQCEVERRLFATSDSAKYAQQLQPFIALVQQRFNFTVVEPAKWKGWFRKAVKA
jgi:MinD-like ATPase involved in chromosome partitioning or flagellar assembly